MMDWLWEDLEIVMAGNRVIQAGSIVLPVKSLEICFNYVVQMKHRICR